MIAHGHGLGRGIINRAGVIAAFFDIGRESGLAQHHAHLFGDGDEDIAEEFELYGVVASHQNHFTGKTPVIPIRVHNTPDVRILKSHGGTGRTGS
jgi:hypothetical protein